MKSLLAALTVLVPFACFSQAMVLTTNWQSPNPHWRFVGGKVVNTKSNYNWRSLSGKVLYVSNQVSIVATQVRKTVYGRFIRDELTSRGNFLGTTPGRPAPRESKTVIEDGPTVAFTNAPTSDLVVGKAVTYFATPVGAFHLDSQPIELFDLGTPYMFPVVRTNFHRAK